MPKRSPALDASRGRNWLIFQLRGALSSLNVRILQQMTEEERKLAYEIEGKLIQLIKSITDRKAL